MNDLSIMFPLQKIDKEKRIVTGIATANNLDKEDDLITFEASVDAFSNWVGNIREMHDPKKAVGSILDWRPTRILYRGREYDAIEVDVYISKGAEDTWQKILDKTLKGFSIQGRALERKNIYDNEAGRMVNMVTKYALNELSVVDNPCNPAGMFLLIKSAPDGTLVSAVDDEDKGVYYCSEHQYATIDSSVCPSCIKEMEKIGIVKEFDAAIINKMIAGYDLEMKGGSSNTMDLQEKNKDDIVSNMDIELTEEQQKTILGRLGDALFSKSEKVSTSDVIVPNITINIEKGAVVEEETVVEEVDSKDEDVVEKSADSDNIEKDIEEDSHKEEEDMDLEKLSALLDEKLEKVKSDISADVDEKISTISKSVDEFKEQTEVTISEAKDEIEKVANTGAGKKSVDIEDEVDEDVIEKSVKTESFWGGIFVPQEIVEVLGYES